MERLAVAEDKVAMANNLQHLTLLSTLKLTDGTL